MGERQPLPLYPLDSLTPFVAGLWPRPGAGSGMLSLASNEDAERPHATMTARGFM